MDEVLFISEDFLKSNSVISNNTDFKNLTSTIITAQDIDLQQILGTPLYEDLQDKMLESPNGLNADEINLIKKYIQKYLRWCVMVRSTPEFKFRYMNKGVMVKNSENSQPADTNDLLMIMDIWRNNAEHYGELLINYLKCNIDKFPKYAEVSIIGLNASNTNYSTGIYLDDYNYEQEEPRKIISVVNQNQP